MGRVVGEENGELLVMANPFMPDEKTRVKVSDVKSRRASTISMMPPGLINSLNPDELQDLLAYVLSGGNASDAMFRKLPSPRRPSTDAGCIRGKSPRGARTRAGRSWKLRLKSRAAERAA